MATKLTANLIDDLDVPTKPLELRDSKQPGLVLRIQPTGLRVWYLEFRRAGRKSRVKLGTYPTMPVTLAQAEAAKKRGDALSGKDPAAKSRATRTTGTFAALFDAYEPWVKENRKSGGMAVRRLRGAFQPWLQKRVAALSLKDVASWREWRGQTRVRGARGPAGAKSRNQDLRMLRAALSWAVDSGRLEMNPLDGLRIKRERERQRPPLRALTDSEERALLDHLDPQDEIHALIVLSLDTGARRAELLTLEWSEVSDDAIIVLDGKSKSRKRRTLPLTPRARAALNTMRRVYGDCGHVFTLKPANLFRRWRAACEAAGIVNRPRWHDLRATFATRLVNAGVPLHVTMQLLGHSSLAITQGYLRLESSDLRGAIDMLAAREMKA